MPSDNVKNQMETYKKFDLVILNDQKTFGCIISVDENSAKILDNHGYTQIVNAYQIQYKLNTRNNVTRNDLRQVFAVGSSAKVLEGFNKGKVGTIKHIYQDVMFLYNVDFIPTSGIFVEKANNCFLLSSMTKNNQKPGGVNQSAPPGQKNLIGQKCGIIAGPWKGYQGIVKEANDRNVRIEIIAKCKIIDYARDKVRLLSDINDNAGTSESAYNDPKTPMHRGFNPQSPYPLQSPGFEATSPGWGVDMASPSYESHLK